MDKQIEIKAQIFDILATQEQIRLQHDQLEQQKQQLLKNLNEIIQSENENK
jgi:hypothetical protein